jgi:hypothetical protein
MSWDEATWMTNRAGQCVDNMDVGYESWKWLQVAQNRVWLMFFLLAALEPSDRLVATNKLVSSFNR